MSGSDSAATVAKHIVSCLEKEEVEYIFGIPGEENIRLVDAIHDSSIRFVLVRHEQAAAFMADVYGRLTMKAGVCFATLGAGALNLLSGVADAGADSAPLVAITSLASMDQIHKKDRRSADLLAVFKPVTKWADAVLAPAAVPALVRNAFAAAQTGRPGSAYLAVPRDVEGQPGAGGESISAAPASRPAPDPEQLARAVELLKGAEKPVALLGHGVVRGNAGEAVGKLIRHLNIPAATTFLAKGAFSDKERNALGVIGFMQNDYENFAFDQADLVLCIGYGLDELDPARINPRSDKKIIHIDASAGGTDGDYPIAANIAADIEKTALALADALEQARVSFPDRQAAIKNILEEELAKGAASCAFPLRPQRLVHDIRQAMDDDGIVLTDTGAIKMWMARLYPAYRPNTCVMSHSLSSMGFSLPGAIAAKLAYPDKKVLAVMGDAAFMMNSQELETAAREKVPLVAVVCEDRAYGLIKWKMDSEIGHHDNVDFTNPDFVAYAESFGAVGTRIESAEDLLPTLRQALGRDSGVQVICCPVDYHENLNFSERLGQLTMTL
ncbi:MAG: acetolactate synthase large subunit [Planctomycetes bacterium]|nr:acetolactate synthase large subunit [Planctomycetota bacterium]